MLDMTTAETALRGRRAGDDRPVPEEGRSKQNIRFGFFRKGLYSMDNSDVYASADSGKVISPEWGGLEALKKAISKHGMPKGIYLDTGEEFIRVFGEGEDCVKARSRRALLAQLDSLSERTEKPYPNDNPEDLAQATVTVVEALNKLDLSNQMEVTLKKLNAVGLGI